MNLQIATIVEDSSMTISIRINLRLNLKSIAYPKILAPVILIEIALQLISARSDKDIHSHRLRFFYRFAYYYSLIDDLFLWPCYDVVFLLSTYQQPPKHKEACYDCR